MMFMVQECAGGQLFGLLQQLHSMPVHDIIDEVDSFLSCKVQLIYAHGQPQPLPALEERSHVASELLHAAAACPEAQFLLRDVLVEARHERRWGGARDMRLMHGALHACAVCRYCCPLVAGPQVCNWSLPPCSSSKQAVPSRALLCWHSGVFLQVRQCSSGCMEGIAASDTGCSS